MKTVATHNGSFHPDDVFAVATMQLKFGVDEVNVIRTRDEEKIAEADYVLDVGGVHNPESGRFDHHQAGAPVRENGIPYAAFGLVWKAFGADVTSEYVAENIERAIVQPIDAGDNGVSLYELNEYKVQPAELFSVISSYSPIEERSEEAFLEAFLEAVTFARGYLERLIAYYTHQETENKKAGALYEASESKEMIIAEEHISKNMFIQFSDVKVLVAPVETEEGEVWRATVIPKDYGTFETRASFPAEWGGLRAEDLRQISGIEDAQFCHRAQFLFVAKSKEGAVAGAKVAMNE